MRRRVGTRSARRARPRPAQAAPGSEPAAKGSLRDAAVGCPERAQVGPLPWLSKSRRSRLLVGYPDSGVPNDRLLGNAHMAAPLWKQPHLTGPIFWAEPPGYAALRAARDRPGWVRQASDPGDSAFSETRRRRG